MTSSQKIAVTEDSQVGEARRAVQEIAQRCGLNETRSGQAAIVVTELARNLVRHGGGGEIVLREIPQDGDMHLEVHAIDRGPGVRNLSEALRDGYSTGGTAGNGLGSVRRLADQFEIYSQPGKGTIVWSRLGHPRETGYDLAGISVALDTEEVCGDAWDVLQEQTALRVIVADGLGHGAFAGEAAREAVTVFRQSARRTPAQVMELIHGALTKTRGAAGAMVDLTPALGQLTSTGVGNISMRLVSPSGAKSLVSQNGTLGGGMRRVQEYKQPWASETLLIMHSDGLSAQWNLQDYPGLAGRHPSLIAGVLYRDFRRERDDATVVVVRQQA